MVGIVLSFPSGRYVLRFQAKGYGSDAGCRITTPPQYTINRDIHMVLEILSNLDDGGLVALPERSVESIRRLIMGAMEREGSSPGIQRTTLEGAFRESGDPEWERKMQKFLEY